MKYFCAAAILFASFHAVARADDAADAKALLTKVIEANGGAEALGKIVAVSFKCKGTSYSGDEKTAVSLEAFCQGDDKMRITSTKPGTTTPDIEVVNGKNGWAKDAGKDTEDMGDAELATERETIYVAWIGNFVPLKGKDFQLSLLEESDIDGRKAVGLLVQHEKHVPVKLYFDKESHLLVKSQMPYKDAESGKTISDEALYSDYTTVDGTKQPRKVVTLWDGVKVLEVETETKLYDKPLDDKLFVKP